VICIEKTLPHDFAQEAQLIRLLPVLYRRERKLAKKKEKDLLPGWAINDYYHSDNKNIQKE